MLEFIKEVFVLILSKFICLTEGINSTQIALVSISVTLFLFFMGKRKENKLKIYEIRKENYIHLLKLFADIFSSTGDVKSMQNKIKKRTSIQLVLPWRYMLHENSIKNIAFIEN